MTRQKPKEKKSEFDKAIVNLVRDLRILHNYTQADIAEVLGFTPGYIGQVETPTSPSKYNTNHLNKLALEFGCSPHDLIPANAIDENFTGGRKNHSTKKKKSN
jgi:transcriptional regulator with XRE-family HTH domain